MGSLCTILDINSWRYTKFGQKVVFREGAKSAYFRCATIVVKNNETNDKFYRKVAFPRYTESVKFMSQSGETASKLKPHRGLGTRLPSPS